MNEDNQPFVPLWTPEPDAPIERKRPSKLWRCERG
jgi:hypothetical protein